MDLLNFVANIIASLAWPCSIIILIFLMRKPIRDLLPLLQRLKYKEFELEFGKRVEEVKEEIETTLPGEGMRILSSPEVEPLIKLAEISAPAAVLEAWRSVEHTAIETAQRLGGNFRSDKPLTVQAIRFLERQEFIDRNIVSLLRDLRGLRNEAAHAPNFVLSKESALEYSASAAAVARYLNSIGKES
jgi:hypothetical protein